ncbi:MAG: TetR/AcrR family transcriptional regulator [Proteobacteria bacterium]|nr:TetR/AcrR family transcriptional regulator [Pseudomonadota bacterium]
MSAPLDHRPVSAAVRPGAAGRGSRGPATRALIVDAAMRLAAREGLEGLSIGGLALETQMSKSGVFAHFGSREELQLSVIREYHARFERDVFAPALTAPRGLPRLRALFEAWMRQVGPAFNAGCLYISGAIEFDDRPSPVRDALEAMVRTWQQTLARTIAQAVAEGHLNPDTDVGQWVFEVHGLALSLHHDARFLRSPDAVHHALAGFARLLRHDATPAGLAAAAGAPTATHLK